MKKLAEEIVHDLLDELSDRGGFSGWWDDVDAGIQSEIREELTKSVLSNLKRDASLKEVSSGEVGELLRFAKPSAPAADDGCPGCGRG